MHALAITKLASPSWHRFSLAPDRFRHWFGNTHNPHIFHCFLTLPGTCDQSGVKSLRAHLAEKLQKSIAFNDVSSNLRGPLEAWGWEDKKMANQSGRQRAPKAFAKNIHCSDWFCYFCSSGSIWWPLPARPSCSKWAKNHCVYTCFEKSRGAMLRPEGVQTKNWRRKVDAKEPPRHLRKTLIFLCDFASFALRDPSGGRSRRALHVQNQPKSIDCITFRTSRRYPTQGTKGNIQNCKQWIWY